jgi:hypothetical protein
MIYLTQKHIEEIEKHGEGTYPYECGGMLIGSFAENGSKTVVETFPLENSSQEDQKNRVLILPKDLLRVERYAREKKIGCRWLLPFAPGRQSRSVAIRLGSRFACLVLYYRFGFARESRRSALMGNGK